MALILLKGGEPTQGDHGNKTMNMRGLSTVCCMAALMYLSTNAPSAAQDVPSPSSDHQSPATPAEPLSLEPLPTLEPGQSSFVPLFRLTTPYYDNILATPQPQSSLSLNTSPLEPEATFNPLIGLFAQPPKTGAWNLTLYTGITQTYDSNLRESHTNALGDTYTTPTIGATLQAGSPDPVRVSDAPDGVVGSYDTIIALNAHYELSADIFASHSGFDALNQRAQAQIRIGRSAAIWRPYATVDDVTGSNLLTAETLGRIRRQHLETGLISNYQLTSCVSASQTFSHLFFEHPENDDFVNFEVWRAHQEVAFRAIPNVDLFVWNEYSFTDPNEGSSGEEIMNGIGWRGRPDPRVDTELLVGWDQQHLSGDVPGRRDQSGVRLRGKTSFDYSPRLRLNFLYNRAYTFNEQTPDDNYVNNTLQFAPEIFLGGNWYVTPYFGISYNEYESSYQESLEIRPELEVAYALPNDSRVFAKIGYDHQSTLNGPSLPVEIYRASVGVNWTF